MALGFALLLLLSDWLVHERESTRFVLVWGLSGGSCVAMGEVFLGTGLSPRRGWGAVLALNLYLLAGLVWTIIHLQIAPIVYIDNFAFPSRSQLLLELLRVLLWPWFVIVGIGPLDSF